MAVENTGFGTLFKLCPEIRLQIWRELLKKDSLEPLKTTADLAIIRASSQFHNEISHEFWGPKLLINRIKISPHYKHQSWITISNAKGREWPIENLGDAASQGFRNLPYGLLKQLIIEIEAPDGNDPGQMVCLFMKAKDLVKEILERATSLPSVEVHLLDTKHAKWFPKVPQESLWMDPVNNPIDPEVDEPAKKGTNDPIIDHWDFEVILALFAPLRRAADVRLKLPEDLAEYCTENELVVNWNAWRDSWDNEIRCIHDYLDDWFMAMDRRLDTLGGPTAAMMRLERFSSWYEDHLHGRSTYEKELQRIISAGRGRTSGNDVFAIGYRYRAMRALDVPGAPAWLHSKSTFPMNLGDGSEERTQYTRAWTTERWYTKFPFGIGPLAPSWFPLNIPQRSRDLVQEDWSYIYDRFLYKDQKDEGNMRDDLEEVPWNPFSIMAFRYESYSDFRLRKLGVHITKKAFQRKGQDFFKRGVPVLATKQWALAVCNKPFIL